MKANDCDAFLRALAVMAEVYAESVSEERGMAYFRALSDLPLEAVTTGMDVAMRMQVFFPKPAELRDWARGRDPKLMDAARKRGWNPEDPRFLPTYDGHGAPSPSGSRPLDGYLPAPTNPLALEAPDEE